VERFVDLDDAVPSVLRRRNRHRKADMRASDARARLDELVDRGGHACEEHRVEVLDVDSMRDRRGGHDHSQRVLDVLRRRIELLFGLPHDRLDRPGLDAAANQVGADAFDDRAAPEVPMLSVRDARKRGQYLISALLVRDVGESDTMEVDSGCDDVETAGERSESAPTTGA
jgi:hypothetical protein